MDQLRIKSQRIIDSVSLSFRRYLFDDIDWNDRLIIITGSRGIGKTTLMLQRLKSESGISDRSLYVSMDDLYFSTNTLTELADDFVLNGGEYLFADEIHKYPQWSKEIKNIYDFNPGLKLVLSGSSALEIYQGETDLSRRASVYHLSELSYREYLELVHNVKIQTVTLSEILKDHKKISQEVNQKIKPVKYFKEYLKQGAYPFIVEGEKKHFNKIESTINVILENDLPATANISYRTTVKLKKMMGLIAASVPFKPNIKSLSEKVETSRDQLMMYLDLLEKSGLIRTLRVKGIGTSHLTKPDKIYLSNPTLMNALNSQANIGNMRETFFLNQLSLKHEVNYPKQGDFLIDNELIFEIGGKNKKFEQIKDVKNAWVVSDDLEYGYGKKIPLWQFGLLY